MTTVVDLDEFEAVPVEEQLDVDEGPGANALEGGDDTEDLDRYRTELRGEPVEGDLA